MVSEVWFIIIMLEAWQWYYLAKTARPQPRLKSAGGTSKYQEKFSAMPFSRRQRSVKMRD